jgi:hypothetical protein
MKFLKTNCHAFIELLDAVGRAATKHQIRVLWSVEKAIAPINARSVLRFILENVGNKNSLGIGVGIAHFFSNGSMKTRREGYSNCRNS